MPPLPISLAAPAWHSSPVSLAALDLVYKDICFSGELPLGRLYIRNLYRIEGRGGQSNTTSSDGEDFVRHCEDRLLLSAAWRQSELR